MGLYKKLNVCMSNNLDFVTVHYSIHVLHLGRASSLLIFFADRGISSGECFALCTNSRAFNTINTLYCENITFGKIRFCLTR